MNNELDVEARIELERVLGEMEEIEQVIFVPKTIALRELSAQDGLGPIAELQANNPLPDALRLKFSIRALKVTENNILTTLLADKRVLSLRYYPSTRVQYASLVEKLGLLGIGLSGLAVLGVLMAVFLVAAADVVDDQRRIELYTLLGASKRFIRRPYLYRATWLGILSGFIACLVITSLNELFSNLFNSNLKALDSSLVYLPVDGRTLIGVAIVALSASWIGAERAVSQRLNAFD